MQHIKAPKQYVILTHSNFEKVKHVKEVKQLHVEYSVLVSAAG